MPNHHPITFCKAAKSTISWQVAGVGDFNGDGHDDMLLRHMSGTLTDQLGNGNGGFTDNWSHFAQPLPNEWLLH